MQNKVGKQYKQFQIRIECHGIGEGFVGKGNFGTLSFDYAVYQEIVTQLKIPYSDG